MSRYFLANLVITNGKLYIRNSFSVNVMHIVTLFSVTLSPHILVLTYTMTPTHCPAFSSQQYQSRGRCGVHTNLLWQH